MKFEAFGVSINTKGSIINPNIKLVAYPGFAIAILTILLFLTISTGFSRIQTQTETLRAAESDVSVLATKVEILREISAGILGHTDTSIMAMPEKNSGLWTLWQIKSLAQTHEVEISSIGFGSQAGQSGLGGVSITFDARGNINSIINYLKDVETLAPVMILDVVGLSSDGGEFIASTAVATHWASLPTKLPPLTQPITRLSQSEEDLLNRLGRLNRPEFTTLFPTEEPSGRDDPFN